MMRYLHKILLLLLITLSSYLDAGWSSPIDVGTSDATSGNIAVNSAGEAIAVWVTSNTVQVSMYDGSSWSTPTTLTADGQQGTVPVVAINSSGNAVVAWRRTSPSIAIEIVTYNGSSWSSITTYTPDVDNYYLYPAVAMNTSGSAIVVWTMSSDNPDSAKMRFSQYNGSSWSAPADLDSTGYATIGTLSSVSLNDSGQAAAVWTCATSGLNPVLIKGAFSSNSGSSWGSSATIHTSSAGADYASTNVQINAEGFALACWRGHDGTRYRAQVATSSDQSTWSSVTSLSESGQNSVSINTSLTSSSSDPVAIATWNRYNGSTFIVYTSEYSSGTWSSSTQQSDTGDDCYNSFVDLNSGGDALLVWQNGPGSGSYIESTVYSGGSWSTKETISGVDSSGPKVGFNASDFGASIWNHSTLTMEIPDATTYQIQGVIYTNAINPPSGLSGMRKKNYYPFEIDNYNHLTWSASDSEGVVSYNVYRDGTLIGSVSSSVTLAYDDRGMNWDSTYTYTVRSVNSSSEVSSTAASITISP